MWTWLRKLGIRSSEERVRAIEALAHGGPSAIPELIRMIENGDARMRIAAIRALEQIGDPGGVPCLCDCLQDSIAPVRDAAIQALGQIGTAQAAPFLSRTVLDGEVAASEALWKVLFRHFPTASPAAAAYLRQVERGGDCLMPGERPRKARPPLHMSELRRVLALFPDATADYPIPATAPEANFPRPAFPALPGAELLPRPAE